MSPLLYTFAADVKEISFTMEQIQVGTWLLALVPIVVVLCLMLGLKWSGGKSGALSWIVAMAVAFFVFKADLSVLVSGTAKGIWTTIFVLYIIWSSMFLYNIAEAAGAFKVIANTFTRLTNGNRIIQLLTLGWAFPSFIQGVCGFGVPVAVAAPLLVGIGFDPIFAAATALIGHSWSVTFGSLGSSYSVLVAFNPDLDATIIARYTSYSIVLAGILCGAFIIHMYGGFKAFKEAWVVYLLIALGLGGTTIIMTHFVTPYVGSFTAGMVGMVMGGVVAPKLSMYARKDVPTDEASIQAVAAADAPDENYSFNLAFSGYYILIGVVFLIYLTPLKAFLNQWSVGLPFPELNTGLGYLIAEESKYSSIKIFTAPGTIIVISAFFAYLFYKAKGKFPAGGMKTVASKSVNQALGATVTVLTMSMMAVLMVDTGMTEYLAVGLAKYTGNFYALAAPMVGNLGAFMTGSNTNSNILFTALQRTVADVLVISPYIMLGLQSTGGALGNMISPMNIALGTGVTGTGGREGEVMGKTLGYGIIGPIVVGLFGFILYRLIPGMM